jgi:hypothetical protein
MPLGTDKAVPEGLAKAKLLSLLGPSEMPAKACLHRTAVQQASGMPTVIPCRSVVHPVTNSLKVSEQPTVSLDRPPVQAMLRPANGLEGPEELTTNNSLLDLARSTIWKDDPHLAAILQPSALQTAQLNKLMQAKASALSS